MAQEQINQTPQPHPELDAVLASQKSGQQLDSQYDDDATAGFETDEVTANRGREQGLGMGERELNAQSDAGVDVAADEDEIDGTETDETDEDEDDVEELDGDAPMQGEDETEEDTGSGV